MKGEKAMKFMNIAKRYGVKIGAACGIVAAPAMAFAADPTPPTDLASLFAILDVSSLSTQVLLVYGVGAFLLLLTIGYVVLVKSGKKLGRAL